MGEGGGGRKAAGEARELAGGERQVLAFLLRPEEGLDGQEAVFWCLCVGVGWLISDGGSVAVGKGGGFTVTTTTTSKYTINTK